MSRTLRCLILALFGAIHPVPAADPLGGSELAPAYKALVRDAMRGFTTRDFKTTLALVDKADQMYPATANTLNIRAAVAIEQGKYTDGRDYCMKSLNVDPAFFPALFNLAEIPFMQGKYAEARLAYEKLLEEDSSGDLIKFRLYLTYLLEKDDERAKAQLDKIPLLNDTPIYFFAFAAWEFAHGDEKKAQSYLNSAETVFPKAKLSNFSDVFYDIGWMKRPTGNDQ